MARIIGAQIALGGIGDVATVAIGGEQMIKRLVLLRTHAFRDSLPPFFGIGEFRIDIEHDAAKFKQVVLDHLSDIELR